MTRLLTLDDLGLDDAFGTRVFLRTDLNVPLSETGRVLDRTRIEEALPTIRELSEAGARVFIASHLGRPAGSRDPRFSLRPVAKELVELLGKPVRFAYDCVGPERDTVARVIEPGGICLLENLRFHAGEKANDPGFAAALARGIQTYVGDAFGTAHRAHASIVGVPELCQARAAGRLLVREVESLERLLGECDRPFVAVLGGAKIGGKIDVVESLLERVDTLLVGGGMANTLLAARGTDLGDSLVEEDRLDVAREVFATAKKRGVEVVLPKDVVVTDDLDEPGRTETKKVGRLQAGDRAVDIGPDTRSRFAQTIAGAGTVFWNGPMGVFEKPPFDEGTRDVARALLDCPGFTAVGGGETVAAVRQTGFADDVGHLSTGGGASLELLAGKKLPGVEVLSKEAAAGGGEEAGS